MEKTEAQIYKELSAPFEEEDLEWRCGATNAAKDKCLALAYVTNRAIMRRLDEVVGWTNWFPTYRPHHKGVVCALSIRVNGEWITKEDGADETDVESTKGGISDSMKRAAVQFGIGRYLYDAEATWEPVKQVGKSTVLASRPKLKLKPRTLKSMTVTVEEAFAALRKATTYDELKASFNSLPANLKTDPEVTALKDELKEELND